MVSVPVNCSAQTLLEPNSGFPPQFAAGTRAVEVLRRDLVCCFVEDYRLELHARSGRHFRRGKKRARIAEITDQTSQLIDSLTASGTPYVRAVGIIAPRAAGR